MPVNSIEVEHFTKKFGAFTAVDDISFTVEQGFIFAFLGPNGAGKSTTINTLCTILEKTSGTLRINGNDVTHRKDKVRSDIGIVFQESTLDRETDGRRESPAALRLLQRSEGRGGRTDRFCAQTGRHRRLEACPGGQSVGRDEAQDRDRPRAGAFSQNSLP